MDGQFNIFATSMAVCCRHVVNNNCSLYDDSTAQGPMLDWHHDWKHLAALLVPRIYRGHLVYFLAYWYHDYWYQRDNYAKWFEHADEMSSYFGNFYAGNADEFMEIIQSLSWIMEARKKAPCHWALEKLLTSMEKQKCKDWRTQYSTGLQFWIAETQWQTKRQLEKNAKLP